MVVHCICGDHQIIHNLSPSLSVHSQIVHRQVGVVPSIVTVRQFSVSLHLISLAVLRGVSVLSTVYIVQLTVSYRQIFSTIVAPAMKREVDYYKKDLM